jgi:hypothetical protein
MGGQLKANQATFVIGQMTQRMVEGYYMHFGNHWLLFGSNLA